MHEVNVLFVCTGNTCRSPLAEVLAEKAAAERGLTHIKFESAGTGAVDGVGASDGAMLIALERGLDLGSHRSRRLTRELVADSDLILGMSEQHVSDAVELGGAGKSFLLDSYATGGSSAVGVSDPFGGHLDAYRGAADDIAPRIELLLDRLASREQNT